jgi:hypothetical protein
MSEALNRYRNLERRLVYTRWINLGYESPEEDGLLEAMDDVWWELAAEEREMIDREPPKSLIRTKPPERWNGQAEVDVLGSPGEAPRVWGAA